MQLATVRSAGQEAGAAGAAIAGAAAAIAPATVAAPAAHGRVLALDGLRGMAIVGVLLMHFGGGASSSHLALRAFGLAIRYGAAGVDLFFVLSGFLITGILWDSRGAEHWWRNFMLRRVLRIFPLYYAYLLLIVVSLAVTGRMARGLPAVGVYALYLQNTPHLYRSNVPGALLDTAHLWSLAIEEQFYLLWPWCLRLLPSANAGVVLSAVLFVAATVLRYRVVGTAASDWGESLLGYSGGLALGGGLALALRAGHGARVERWAGWVCAVGVAGFLVVGARDHGNAFTREDAVVGRPLLLLGFVGLMAMCLRPGMARRVFEHRTLRWFGGLSYGLYVWQGIALSAYLRLAPRLEARFGYIAANLVFRTLLGGALTLALGWLSFHYFEMPFLRLKERFGGHGAPPETRDGVPAP